jgi:hypothetical protein
MGADIYLESVTEKARAKYEPLFKRAVARRDHAKGEEAQRKAQKSVMRYYGLMSPADGYYRDSYNPSAFLWLIGLSWWSDVTPMLEEGYLPIAKAQELLDMIERRPVTLERVTAHLRALNENDKVGGINGKPADWLKRWQQDKQDLCTLLRKSIELNEPLLCSL